MKKFKGPSKEAWRLALSFLMKTSVPLVVAEKQKEQEKSKEVLTNESIAKSCCNKSLRD
ncbi:hypothetical protein [Metabacillus fastidiosus]|uniref:hypothetical protein n=1 Tax=Metabacillus fastidiosus TaxID=1458 RepID=UPI000B3346CD|nr:hypothetical protein [Metabacillus fastidiosus]MED4461819.1 hypothetical protein [Metabacillus fastidiosus]